MGFINQLITEGAPSCMNLHLHLRTETHQPGISAWHFPHARTLNLEHTRYVPPLPLCCTVVLCDKVGPQTMWKIGISRAVVPQWGKSRAELVRLYSNSHETYMVYGRYLTNYLFMGFIYINQRSHHVWGHHLLHDIPQVLFGTWNLGWKISFVSMNFDEKLGHWTALYIGFPGSHVLRHRRVSLN